MAYRTVFQLLHSHSGFVNQLLTLFQVIFIRNIEIHFTLKERSLPSTQFVLVALVLEIEVKNLLPRRKPLLLTTFGIEEELLGVPMAIETPFHVQGLSLVGEHHLFNSAMAVIAAQSSADMNAVVEIDEFGNFVHLRPNHGLVVLIAGANGF